jgi:enoyl-CoA hydratase
MADEIARFPQTCVRSDRASVYKSHGKRIRDGLRTEWEISKDVVVKEGIAGAARFSSGKGRHGKFDDIG